MKVVFSKKAEKDYYKLLKSNPNNSKKIDNLITKIQKNDKSLNPKSLQGNLKDCLSLKIDKKNRLVYQINREIITIIKCKGHYDDK